MALREITAAEHVAALYERIPCERSFREDLEAHLLHGYVFSTPAAFLMGRTVRKEASSEAICDPWHVFPSDQCDMWLAYAYAGKVKDCLRFLPYPLEYVAWQRVGDKGRRLRVYRMERFRYFLNSH